VNAQGDALVIASRNPAKVNEFRRLLARSLWRVVALDDVADGADVQLVEPGPDYAANAVAKAVAASLATSLPTLGDDSGIEVEALHGWPGPNSARWLGPDASDADRLRELIEEVSRRSADDRRVRYVAAIAVARPGGEPVVAHGTCDGVLVEPRGTGGFGYDPGFLSSDLGVTFGEASDTQKDTVSHRARALRRLAESGVLTPPDP
jgi:XTP/dITP diphosphohydrolase